MHVEEGCLLFYGCQEGGKVGPSSIRKQIELKIRSVVQRWNELRHQLITSLSLEVASKQRLGGDVEEMILNF